MDAVIINGRQSFDEARIRSALNELGSAGRLSLIDTRGELADPEKLHRLLEQFPRLHFFLPHESNDTAATLNLFFGESAATYLLILSSSLILESIDPDSCVSFLREDTRRMALSPFVFRQKQLLDTLYELQTTPAGDRELSIRPPSDGGATVSPYGLTGFFDREKVLGLGGFQTGYADDGVMGLDLFYRAYTMGMSAHSLEGISCQETSESVAGLSREDLSFFKIKNFAEPERDSRPLGIFLSSLFRLRFERMGRLLHFLKLKKKLAESRLVDDEAILELFQNDTSTDN